MVRALPQCLVLAFTAGHLHIQQHLGEKYQMGDISKAEKTNGPFAYALPQLKPCLAAKSKGDAFSFLLSFFEDGRKKERRKT